MKILNIFAFLYLAHRSVDLIIKAYALKLVLILMFVFTNVKGKYVTYSNFTTYPFLFYY